MQEVNVFAFTYIPQFRLLAQGFSQCRKRSSTLKAVSCILAVGTGIFGYPCSYSLFARIRDREKSRKYAKCNDGKLSKTAKYTVIYQAIIK